MNYAGIVSCVCFDKTGTLTEEHLEFKSALVSSVHLVNGGVNNGANGSMNSGANAGVNSGLHNDDHMTGSQASLVLVDCGSPSSSNLSVTSTSTPTPTPASPSSVFPLLCVEIMATCHSLSLVTTTTNKITKTTKTPSSSSSSFSSSGSHYNNNHGVKVCRCIIIEPYPPLFFSPYDSFRNITYYNLIVSLHNEIISSHHNLISLHRNIIIIIIIIITITRRGVKLLWVIY